MNWRGTEQPKFCKTSPGQVFSTNHFLFLLPPPLVLTSVWTQLCSGLKASGRIHALEPALLAEAVAGGRAPGYYPCSSTEPQNVALR